MRGYRALESYHKVNGDYRIQQACYNETYILNFRHVISNWNAMLIEARQRDSSILCEILLYQCVVWFTGVFVFGVLFIFPG